MIRIELKFEYLLFNGSFDLFFTKHLNSICECNVFWHSKNLNFSKRQSSRKRGDNFDEISHSIAFDFIVCIRLDNCW